MLIKLLRNVFSESEAPKTKYKNQTNITDGHTFILTRCGSRPKVRAVSARSKRMQWRDWKEKFGKKRPAYIIIKNNLNKNLKTFLENNHIKSYNWKFFIANKSNPLIYAIPKFWSRFSFSDTKIWEKWTRVRFRPLFFVPFCCFWGEKHKIYQVWEEISLLMLSI